MRKNQRRPLYLIVMALLVALLLSACGGAATETAPPAGQAPAASAGPEDRVKGFFATLSEAFNDPNLSDEARRTELSDRLANYVEPSEQAQVRSDLQQALAEYAATDFGSMIGEEGLDIRLEVRFTVTETRLVEESSDRAQVEVLEGTISTKLVGADVEQMGEFADMINQESSISEFFGEDDDDRLIDLIKIDGVWYFTDVSDFGF